MDVQHSGWIYEFVFPQDGYKMSFIAHTQNVVKSWGSKVSLVQS